MPNLTDLARAQARRVDALFVETVRAVAAHRCPFPVSVHLDEFDGVVAVVGGTRVAEFTRSDRVALPYRDAFDPHALGIVVGRRAADGYAAQHTPDVPANVELGAE